MLTSKKIILNSGVKVYKKDVPNVFFYIIRSLNTFFPNDMD